ncbi:MAG: PDZ domain-containing protein [Ignavibacteria bacterium]
MPDTVNYTLTIEKPFTHYCEVEILLKDITQDHIIFSMPVWTPGSYLIREFAKNVEDVKAENSEGKALNFEKINKNSWKVDTKNEKSVKIKYKAYCNELTVRTSLINTEHAFINSSGTFMYVKGFEKKKCILAINCPAGWNKISTGLEKGSVNIYSAENYDVFIDSPVEIGNQNVLEFDIKGIKHSICMAGKGNYKDETIINDFKKIAEEEIKLFGGEIPYKHYTYIIHLVEKGGGGLEHLNSFVAQASRWIFNDDALYKKFLGLVSHEFFHLWNVKRIRPAALGPFDYETENYTKSLWVAEGWTSFYDDVILRRCDILNNKEYLEFLNVNVNDIMRFKGRFSQSLAESSFDTWIKFYRKDENYSNSQVSYYTKGALVTLLLNIEIIKSTEASASLDDALRMLYEDHKKDQSKGYSEERMKEVCEIVCGKKLDWFWEKYVYGVEELPVKDYLNDCGVLLTDENETSSGILDVEIKNDNGKLIITKVIAGGTAYESGLNANDELIALDGTRVDPVLAGALLKNYKEGDEIKVLINREGFIKELSIIFLKPLPKYKIIESENKTETQQKFFNKWING